MSILLYHLNVTLELKTPFTQSFAPRHIRLCSSISSIQTRSRNRPDPYLACNTPRIAVIQSVITALESVKVPLCSNKALIASRYLSHPRNCKSSREPCLHSANYARDIHGGVLDPHTKELRSKGKLMITSWALPNFYSSSAWWHWSNKR